MASSSSRDHFGADLEVRMPIILRKIDYNRIPRHIEAVHTADQNSWPKERSFQSIGAGELLSLAGKDECQDGGTADILPKVRRSLSL